MDGNNRLGIWLIDNIVFSGNEFEKEIIINGEKIKLLITNYEQTKKLEEPFRDWIHNKIIKVGMTYSNNAPLPINSVFVITKTTYKNEDSSLFTGLLKLCLRLVYYPPTLISHTAEYIPNAAITLPTWDGWRSSKPSAKNSINSENFDLVIDYFNLLYPLNKSIFNSLEELMQISAINDVLYELMLLWSYIEGFWNENEGDSKLDKSLLNMLTKDYAPGKTKKNSEINTIRQKILNQNELIGAKKYSELRNIIAHGSFLSKQDEWTKEQWKAIYEQRNLLIETLTKSLVNKLKRA